MSNIDATGGVPMASLATALAGIFPTNAATPSTVGVGLAMLSAQCLLAAFFAFAAKTGPWKAQPGFTAHQLVYLPLALYVTYVGCTAWFGSSALTPAERVLGEDAVGLHLAQLQLAVLLLWDIPTGLAVKPLRDPVMLCVRRFRLSGLILTTPYLRSAS